MDRVLLFPLYIRAKCFGKSLCSNEEVDAGSASLCTEEEEVSVLSALLLFIYPCTFAV